MKDGQISQNVIRPLQTSQLFADIDSLTTKTHFLGQSKNASTNPKLSNPKLTHSNPKDETATFKGKHSNIYIQSLISNANLNVHPHPYPRHPGLNSAGCQAPIPLAQTCYQTSHPENIKPKIEIKIPLCLYGLAARSAGLGADDLT